MITIIAVILGAVLGSYLGPFGLLGGAIAGLSLSNAARSSYRTNHPKHGMFSAPHIPTGFNGMNTEKNIDAHTHSIDSFDESSIAKPTTINPTTGLPMISGDTTGVDVGGNLFGTSNDDLFSSPVDIGSDSMFDDNL